jgi:methylated-DNA-protein-cysteine methyltransferase-like protein
MNLFLKIRKLVKKIPPGKVSAYGVIARATNTNPLVVGWAMHDNKDRLIPCHRVVFKDGSLAPGYSFGGEKVQKEKLEKEGVKFINDKINLKKYFWKPQYVLFRRRWMSL